MKRGIAIIATVVALSMCTWLAFRQLREPTYEGKKLSQWLEYYDDANTNRTSEKSQETKAALRAMGTNAIPTLLRMLRTRDARWKQWLAELSRKQSIIQINYIPASCLHSRAERGFSVLGPAAASAAPELGKILDEKISDYSQSSSASALGSIGPAAKTAIPTLIRATSSTNQMVSWFAINAIGAIHSEPDLAVPALVKVIQNTNAFGRQAAVSGLGAFGPDAKSAIPALKKIVEDQKQLNLPPLKGLFTGNDPRYIGLAAEWSLKQIRQESDAPVTTYPNIEW